MGRLGLSHIVYAPGLFDSQTHPEGLSSFTDDEWIEAFYRRYGFWVLRVAEELLKNDHDSGFAVLLILFPYFEMIARHRAGKELKNGFRLGVLQVFDEREVGDNTKMRDEVINWLWQNMRNELAHNAFTGKGVAISGGYKAPIVWELNKKGDVTGVGINPHIWVERIRQDFEECVRVLRDPANASERERFLRYAKRYVNQAQTDGEPSAT